MKQPKLNKDILKTIHFFLPIKSENLPNGKTSEVTTTVWDKIAQELSWRFKLNSFAIIESIKKILLIFTTLKMDDKDKTKNTFHLYAIVLKIIS